MKGKILNTSNINDVVKYDLCTSCGVCQNICATHAITISNNKGINIPFINPSLCNDCGLCFKVCGGHGVNIQERANILFQEPDIKTDYYIGKYVDCYSGYSNDHDIRFHSASGGALSQLLIFLLEKNIIEGAIVVGFDSKEITKPKVFIAKTKDEFISARSSKYCTISYNGIYSQIKDSKGKYAIVGLPCHIHSFRKYEELNRKFKNKIHGYFALYCSGQKTTISQEYIFKKYSIRKTNLKYFSYRDDGCLGYLKTIDQNNEIKKIPYKEYYHSMRGFFTPTRCTICIDHYGELADLCFGDLHVGDYKKDKIGVNSMISRTTYWDNVLNEAKNEGIISLERISPNTINSSQIYVEIHQKGNGVITALKMRRYLGMHNPLYDAQINGKITLKGIIRYYAHVISRFIGRHRKLWFMVSIIDRIALYLSLGQRRKEVE